jgi:hypothetical protein
MGEIFFGKGTVLIVEPTIVAAGLLFHVDASNPDSYPGTGTTWFDLSGSRNGTFVNNPTFSTESGGTLVFNGSNQVDFGLPPVTGNSSWSFGLWLKPTTSNGGTPFFMGNTSTSQAMLTFWGGSSNPRVRMGRWGGDVLTPTLNHPQNVWTYVSYTWDGSTLRSYTNNLASGTASGFGGFNIANSFMSIGSANGNQNFFGLISEVHVYNRALPIVEIEENFNVTKGRFGL